jgi:hypothetical protein
MSRAYGFNGYVNVFPAPIVQNRAPVNGTDTGLNGQIWIDTVGQDAYTMVDAANAVWVNTGGGGGAFANLTVNPGPTNLTGALTVNAAGNQVNISTDAVANTTTIGNITGTTAVNINSGTGGVGIVTTNGVFAVATGTGSINIGTDAAAKTITIGNATVVTNVVLNAGGIFDVNTTGAVTVDTAAGISLDAATASNFTVTGAGIDLTLSSVGGSVVVSATEDVADAVSLIAAAGGINIQAVGEAGQDIQIVNTGGSVTMTASEATLNAIRIAATDAAGGIDIDAGTTGIVIDTTGGISLDAAAPSNFTATGAFDVTVSSTAGSVNINGGEAATDAVLISASNATGGITLDSGVVPGIRITNGTQTAQLLIGAGDPNGAVTGLSGSLYIRTGQAGAPDTTLYVNTDAVSGVAWTALTST